ncbi:hypothetical protein F5Y08DRAFT_317323 [Xylaria arbuscula]|nr:hypothetical protein F5Y08DRAFT_317323 [Xylaria arbuscula]
MAPLRRRDVVTGGKSLRDHLSSAGSESTQTENSASLAPRFHRQHVLSHAGHDYMAKITPDHIFNATQHHVSYKWNLTTLKGLDKYNDCTQYELPEESERGLLQREVIRLVEVATSKTALLFESRGDFDESVDGGFMEVSHIADQIRCAMGIVRLDNARISLQHCTAELNETIHSFRQARRRLMGRYNTDQSRVEGSAPVQLQPKERNQRLYHALVDFITGSVARLLVRTAVSKYWSQCVLSSLASFAVKLKTLEKNTEKFASYSIATAEDALESMNQSNVSKEALLIKIRPSPDDAAKDVDTVDTETDTSRHYHLEKTLVHREIYWLIRRVLHNILIKGGQTSSASSFEIYTTVYKAGFDALPTVLTSDRLGEVSVSSDFFVVKNAYTALSMAKENIEEIERRRHPRVPPMASSVGTRNKDQSTMIRCEWMDPEAGKAAVLPIVVKTEHVDEVFSIAIPLSLSTAWAARSLAQLVSSSGIGTDEEDPILQFRQPPRHFEAHFTVTTADWKEKERRIAQQEYKDNDITTLPQNPIRFGVRAGTTNFATTYNTNPSSNEKTRGVIQDYLRDKDEMSKWIISEDSIKVECRKYVILVLCFVGLIVSGGIVTPFLVGNKLAGVDPFQITIFIWVIAGVIILVAKGRYVSDWPWHEFIHGHVVCRTLRETCEASGISSQAILMYLLLNEWNTILRTRGPYNGMFSRRTQDGEGFPINEPSHISTMMSSGFVILKVLNVFGEHLVCLDARRGTDFVTLFEVSPRLVCERLEDYDNLQALDGVVHGRKGQGEGREIRTRNSAVKRLARQNFRVDRILGIYIGDDYFG